MVFIDDDDELPCLALMFPTGIPLRKKRLICYKTPLLSPYTYRTIPHHTVSDRSVPCLTTLAVFGLCL